MSRSVRPRRSAALAASAALSRESSPESSPARTRRAPPRRAQSPDNDSDSSLSSLSDDEPAPKRARAPARSRAKNPAKRKRAPAGGAAVDVTLLRDNELYASVMDPDNGEDAAENWVVLFQTDPADAVAQLATPAVIDQDMIRDASSAEDRVAEIQDEFSQNAPAQYPIVSRAKTMRHVRRAAADLVAKLLHDASEAEIASHDDLLPMLQPWLCALTASPLRALRHTATVVVLWLLKGLSGLREQTQTELGIAERQQQAEQDKAHANETRLAHMRQKIDTLDDVREFIDTRMDELVHDIFVPRFRDLDGAIRSECMTHLEELCATYPGQYLQTFYFRLIGGALLDPATNVRLHALRAVQSALIGDNFALVSPFISEFKRRLVDIALGDVEMSVRIAAFALLERANAHGMLASEERSSLAVHVFDVEPRVRVAAAAFLATLVEADTQDDAEAPIARVRRLVTLLMDYSRQLDTLDESPPAQVFDEEDIPLLTASLGRVGIALEALWEAAPSLRAWAPYFDLLLNESDDRSLSPEEESVAVEAAVAAVRLVRDSVVEEDEVSPLEACSTALIDLLPKLLSRFATDAPRITDLLLIPQFMDLDVFAETRNVAVYDALWDSICAHFLRHVEPTLLHNAAESLKMLSASNVSLGTGPAKLRALVDTVLGSLLGVLRGRSLETSVFTEDDMHNIRASLLRLYALTTAVNIGTLDEPPADCSELPWDQLVAIARRGRLGQEREVQAVRVALKTLALALMWHVKQVTSESDGIDLLLSHRDTLLGALYDYTGNTDENVSVSLCTTACYLTTVLHALFFKVGADTGEAEDDSSEQLQSTENTRLQLSFPEHVQQLCADTIQRELTNCLAQIAAVATPEASAHTRKTRRDAGLVPLAVLMLQRRVDTLATPVVGAIRIGAMDIKHIPAVLGLYACFDSAYNNLCHDLVTVLRDDALHLQRAWVVCATLLESLKQSFARHASHTSDGTEAQYVSLSRQLSNATMIRGPGFSIVKSIDADAMITLHVSGVQFIVQSIQEGMQPGVACAFFKGLANILTTLVPGDAIKMSLRQRFSAADLEPTAGAKEWEPFFSYEKRLLNLASKDPSLVQEVASGTAPESIAEE
ncbi:cohesin complex subunit [Malassezia cuniculi]|uniref:Cohesin complex subunit n=1 Tax=Malassezia cuniculi TaxID=948313 RepID=A0AAF0J5C1_9BASI|nr:cohesin complex subunit [Malassezia cuniculi]